MLPPPREGSRRGSKSSKEGKNYVRFAVSALHAVSTRARPQAGGGACILCSERWSVFRGGEHLIWQSCAHRSPGLPAFQEVPSLWDLLSTYIGEHWLLGGGWGTSGVCWGLELPGFSPSPSCLRCWLSS